VEAPGSWSRVKTSRATLFFVGFCALMWTVHHETSSLGGQAGEAAGVQAAAAAAEAAAAEEVAAAVRRMQRAGDGDAASHPPDPRNREGTFFVSKAAPLTAAPGCWAGAYTRPLFSST
jgi:hypothetical protein